MVSRCLHLAAGGKGFYNWNIKQEVRMAWYQRVLLICGGLCVVMALFQAVLGFFPQWRLYFGAPESLVADSRALVATSFVVAALLLLASGYAFSGAHVLRPLPGLMWGLWAIAGIFLVRGLLVIPEALVVTGMLTSTISVAPRFVGFSFGALLFGALFMAGVWGAAQERTIPEDDMH